MGNFNRNSPEWNLQLFRNIDLFHLKFEFSECLKKVDAIFNPWPHCILLKFAKSLAFDAQNRVGLSGRSSVLGWSHRETSRVAKLKFIISKNLVCFYF